MSAALKKFKHDFARIVRGIDFSDEEKEECIAFVAANLGGNVSRKRPRPSEPAPLPEPSHEEDMLLGIRQDLRKVVGVSAVALGEEFHYPDIPEYEGYNEHTVAHVDAFLYDDDDVDDLVEEGKLSRHYCAEPPYSRNIKSLNFLSHSLSVDQLRWVFSEAVLGDMQGKTVLDVGSRLGAVLFTGALYSKAKQLVGVEMSPYFAKVQADTAKKFKLQKRIQVVGADVFDRPDLLQTADVIFLNNVFEFFHDQTHCAQCWEGLRKHITRKGTRLVTVPALTDSLGRLDMAPIDVDRWVKELPVTLPDSQANQEEDEDEGEEDDALENFKMIHLYEVLG